MLKHIFKLIWNRKRTNLLMILEIFISFIVLFAVTTFGIFYFYNYNKPLGFEYKNVLLIKADNGEASDDTWTPEQTETIRQLQIAISEIPEVISFSAARNNPYDMGGYHVDGDISGKRVAYQFSEALDGIEKVWNTPAIEGRWFSKEDEASTTIQPVVISQKMRETVFGEGEAIGKNIGDSEMRVVGVIAAFRKEGEFSSEENFMFKRISLSNPKQRPPDNFVLKIQPGTSPEFEERLVKKLQSVAKNWVIEAKWISQLREINFRLKLIPIYILATIAGFLILMVMLGLLGVLWQNVTRRTSEIGLRRALGATAGNIQMQIIGELLMVAAFGVFAGSFLVCQIPLLNLIPFIQTEVFFISLFVSYFIIFGMVVLSSWYPSQISTAVSPIEALRYE